MVIVYIEIERDAKGVGKGNINIIPKGEYCAILHGWKNGKLERTVFKTNTSQENIDKVKASHNDVKIYYTKKEMQLRGLEIKPGTPTIDEIDNLINKLKTKHNIDLETIVHPKTGKTWKKYLKENLEHIGEKKIKCTNCGTINDPVHCSNCSAELSQGEQHKKVFNIDGWG